MRDLIRPTLFLMARLGLFLSVVAWVVGQWWTVQISNDQRAVYLSVDGQAWLGTDTRWPFRSTEVGWHCSVSPTERAILEDMVLLSQVITLLDDELPVSAGASPGVNFRFAGVINIVSIRHWLIVTVFALFYGVLKWVYRKRGTEDKHAHVNWCDGTLENVRTTFQEYVNSTLKRLEDRPELHAAIQEDLMSKNIERSLYRTQRKFKIKSELRSTLLFVGLFQKQIREFDREIARRAKQND